MFFAFKMARAAASCSNVMQKGGGGGSPAHHSFPRRPSKSRAALSAFSLSANTVPLGGVSQGRRLSMLSLYQGFKMWSLGLWGPDLLKCYPISVRGRVLMPQSVRVGDGSCVPWASGCRSGRGAPSCRSVGGLNSGGEVRHHRISFCYCCKCQSHGGDRLRQQIGFLCLCNREDDHVLKQVPDGMGTPALRRQGRRRLIRCQREWWGGWCQCWAWEVAIAVGTMWPLALGLSSRCHVAWQGRAHWEG